MSKTVLALLIANASLFVFAFLGFGSMDEDVLMVTAMLTMAMSVVNGIALYRKRAEPSAPRRRRRAPEALDEMDARTVLDIDARLEALERRERDLGDADLIRSMAARGEQSGLMEPRPESAPVEAVRERV